jgi:dihydroxyacetone kinase-like predicted kinase
MGAAGIVRGGQTDNPSTQEILEAIERVGAPDVIVLPNNPNVILSALQAASMSAKRVSVIPTRSVPQGLAALEAYNGDSDLESNIARMTDSVVGVRTIELTRAVRDATINDIAVAEGEWIVLLDDRLVASGPAEDDVIKKALAGIDIASAELVTVFLGAGATEDDATALEATLLDLNPDLEIQILDGGQAHYRSIIGVQ